MNDLIRFYLSEIKRMGNHSTMVGALVASIREKYLSLLEGSQVVEDKALGVTDSEKLDICPVCKKDESVCFCEHPQGAGR